MSKSLRVYIARKSKLTTAGLVQLSRSYISWSGGHRGCQYGIGWKRRSGGCAPYGKVGHQTSSRGSPDGWAGTEISRTVAPEAVNCLVAAV